MKAQKPLTALEASPAPKTRKRARIRSLVTTLALVAAPGAVVMGTAGDAFAVTKISHSTATSMFSSVGITWSSSGGCSNRNNSTCTSFDQLNLATAQGAQTLKRASGCALNITGGTETGHASGTYSHWNGYKLDFSKSTCLTNYIKGNFAYAGVRGDGAPMYKAGSGNIYADEGNHWDVLYYNCGGC